MTRASKITYDRQANALYIYVRGAESMSQREYSESIILDLGADGQLVGIEALDPGADLTPIIREYGLDPHLLDVLGKIRELIPDTQKRIVLA